MAVTVQLYIFSNLGIYKFGKKHKYELRNDFHELWFKTFGHSVRDLRRQIIVSTIRSIVILPGSHLSSLSCYVPHPPFIFLHIPHIVWAEPQALKQLAVHNSKVVKNSSPVFSSYTLHFLTSFLSWAHISDHDHLPYFLPQPVIPSYQHTVSCKQKCHNTQHCTCVLQVTLSLQIYYTLRQEEMKLRTIYSLLWH
jgi:hypothetical protein